MAEVFRARDERTNATVALKVLHADLGQNEDILELFAREARIGTVVGPSPNIVDVLDAGVDSDTGAPFIAMELLDGETLEHALERGPVPRLHARALIEQLARALDQAHAAGVIHRDLKPSNLFLVAQGDAAPILKVMDFGIAKLLEKGAVRTATQIGTPAYTAPEQMGATTRRLAASQGIVIARGVSAATDVWALGLIAYELLTGEAPGHYWSFETLTELPMTIAFEGLAPASVRAGPRAALLPPGFDAWFERCLKKNAADRWPSAGSAASALLALDWSVPGLSVERVQEPPRDMRTVKAEPMLAAPESPASASTTTLNATAAPTGKPSRLRPFFVALAMCICALSLAWFATKAGRSIANRREDLARACGITEPEGASPAERRAWLENLAREGCAKETCSPAACASLAEELESGEALGSREPDLAGALYQRACTIGSAGRGGSSAVHGCLGLGRQREAAGQREAAREFYRAACDGNVPNGCTRLASLMTERGEAPRTEEKEARQLYERACNGEDLDGCARLGRMVELGRGGWEPNEEEAVALYRRACDGGAMLGCVELGALFARGRGGLARDAVRAGELYDQACRNHEPLGCARLATLVATGEGGRARDERRAYQLVREACQAGAALGCVELGRMVLAGRAGLTPDANEAQALFSRACDGGDGDGCAELGLSHEEGRAGLPRDATKAAPLYRRACDAGSARGCTHLGNLTYLGEGGIERNLPLSFELNERACRDGDPVGCVRLAILCALGEGVHHDAERASALYRETCESPLDENRPRCELLTKLLATPPATETRKPRP
jgi:serine/threonine protein kinase/TPR repeat protein